MSGPDDRDGDGEDERRPDYGVGFGKPPKPHQWKPGQSGNPGGRPPRASGKHRIAHVILQKAREVFIEEGDRKMTLREGGRVIDLTAYRAAVRAAHVSAAKGSAMAQRTVIQERLRIESEISATMCEVFNETVKYKQECAEMRLKCLNNGRPEPIFPIDPDHLLLDWETLTVVYRGPLADDLEGSLKDRLRCRDKWAEDFELIRQRCHEDENRVSGLILALQSQRNYNIINESLPPRLRRALPGELTIEDINAAMRMFDETGPLPPPGA